MPDDRLLSPGLTCWRVAQAGQFAPIVDGADYFRHVKETMLRARHRIMLIGWDFDVRVDFELGEKTLRGPNQLAAFLHWLLWKRPSLRIYMLRSNLRLLPAFDGMWYGVAPVSLVNQLSAKRLHLAMDGAHPLGAVHHQKIVVVDDAVAFCGGIDLTIDRWDTSDHLRENPLRKTRGREYGPRHEVAAAMDGEAARALGEQARERWQTATGRSLPAINVEHTVWPYRLKPALREVDVAIARTLPTLESRDEVREVEALNLAAIAAARHAIYLENQYLAARDLVNALARRLREPDGPDVVIVLPRSSESRLEQEAMDSARARLLQVLWAADEHGRLGVYWPVTEGARPVYVHSKIVVSDDRLLRIGSSNLNNRSLGFDSECDVAIEARPDVEGDDEVRRVIAGMRNRLVSEHLGVSQDAFEAALAERKSFFEAVESLRGSGRTLRKFTRHMVSGEMSLLAENDFMDPDHVPRSLSASLQRFIAGLAQRP
ncbi:phospholipase D/transphosphatidylase [Mycolicibacterium arabiense]|uniref:Phospholipase D/transphosphatidylase n=1 Tax=Mycolicibacterium arabiense TaxID=1286181 RepID=A0A7I7S2Q6_9MYCO|nr:phospholipase D-like domain-containing protein [Mycolicibacterium arabiense]MCV7371966.1 phospholipase [Mycolicibacterium arabiense]BBY50681.1 phospholipase D/transphosphatidylase [Mycolicibacterium arabiense]